ncbi:uncharacterized protein EI90DRAFT_3117885 [Cantharellus anzutake]|uniref:uncharacterized protein n=1 Tax=Cantharellus anzutake TaxID=1750568 RepID=UPI001904F17E|nr:uncharacterized protein EI90DRAFT_3117885 [Cantharellus anzutake]KAF8338819.1 hypothetical protein EI90DRAFT_3117885 [Cantharellus anzutake]
MPTSALSPHQTPELESATLTNAAAPEPLNTLVNSPAPNTTASEDQPEDENWPSELDPISHAMVAGYIDLVLANVFRATRFIARKSGVSTSRVSLLPVLATACKTDFDIWGSRFALTPNPAGGVQVCLMFKETCQAQPSGANNEAVMQGTDNNLDAATAATPSSKSFDSSQT